MSCETMFDSLATVFPSLIHLDGSVRRASVISSSRCTLGICGESLRGRELSKGIPWGWCSFCFAILPTLRAFRARTVGCDGTLGVAHVGDIVTAPAAITPATMQDFFAFGAGLPDAGIALSRDKTLALPLVGHRLTSPELTTGRCRISAATADGLVMLVCLSVRPPSFATACARRRLQWVCRLMPGMSPLSDCRPACQWRGGPLT